MTADLPQPQPRALAWGVAATSVDVNLCLEKSSDVHFIRLSVLQAAREQGLSRRRRRLMGGQGVQGCLAPPRWRRKVCGRAFT